MLFLKKLFEKRANDTEDKTAEKLYSDEHPMPSAPFTLEDSLFPEHAKDDDLALPEKQQEISFSSSDTLSVRKPGHCPKAPMVTGGLPWDFWDIIAPIQQGISFSNTDIPEIRNSPAYKKRIQEILPDPRYAKIVDMIYVEYPDYQEQIESIRNSKDYKERLPLSSVQSRQRGGTIDYLRESQETGANRRSKDLLASSNFTATSKLRNAR